MKYLLAFLVAIAFLFVSTAAEGDGCTSCCDPFIRGDVDGDGDVDVDDVSTFSSCDSTSSCPNIDVYDVEDDGDVDRNDLYQLYGHVYYNNPSTLPQPFPYEGYDPTADNMDEGCDVEPTDATQGIEADSCAVTRMSGDLFSFSTCNDSGGGGNGMEDPYAAEPVTWKNECTNDAHWERENRVTWDADHGEGHDSKNEFTIAQLCGRMSSGDGVIWMKFLGELWTTAGYMQGTALCETCYPEDTNHGTSDLLDAYMVFVFRPVNGSTHYEYGVWLDGSISSKYLSQQEYGEECLITVESSPSFPGSDILSDPIDMADVADYICTHYSVTPATYIVLDHIRIDSWYVTWDDHDSYHDLVKTWALSLEFLTYGVDYSVGWFEDFQEPPE